MDSIANYKVEVEKLKSNKITMLKEIDDLKIILNENDNKIDISQEIYKKEVSNLNEKNVRFEKEFIDYKNKISNLNEDILTSEIMV